ncbi:major facilitator superfamily domain-containing protein 8 isoform X2 [Cherax quadricarinatus]|uniref:major facilitator superfamily domain-containing protein 8 isoform X2 n=1 Tax=Cherax quadricarinatus TaxID=27406 RepID=UPI00387E8F3C
MPAQVADAGLEEASAEVLIKPNRVRASFKANNGNGASVHIPEDESPPVLEIPSERRARRRSHYVVYVTTFVMSIGFSIVLTGVWPYLQQLDPGVSKEFLGWVIAANPLGQMLISPLLGYWGNKAKSNRGAFLFTLVTFTIGNGIYAILSVFGSSARIVMILSRFLVGMSSAERTTAVALTSAAQGLGFIIGPAIQTALAVAFAHNTSSFKNSTLSGEGKVEEAVTEEVWVEWNMYSSTGWIGVFLGLINFFLFFPCVYQECPIAAREAMLQKRMLKDNSTTLPKPDYVCVIGVLFSFFIFLFIYVLLETIIVPMCIDLYAWSDEKAITIVGIGLSLAGALSIIMYALTSVLTRRFDERKVFIFLGLIPMTLGMILNFPMGNTYPKIKNCTIESLLHESFDSTLTSIPDPLELSLTTLPGVHNIAKNEKQPFTLLPEELGIINKERRPSTPSTIVEEMSSTSKMPEASVFLGKTDKMNIIDEEMAFSTVSSLMLNTIGSDMELSALISQMNTTGSEDNIHARRRRHIIRDGVCHDLGCPPEQEWCYYTPIIEIPQLAVSAFLAIIGYPVAFTLSSSFFSKLLGPKPQGVWMGILTSTGGLSRVVGPIFVSYLYTALGTRWTFGILFLLMCIVVVEICFLYPKLIPMKICRAK